MKNKLKRIGAIILVVMLVALYLTTLVLAFIPTPEAKSLFQGFLFTSIVLPVVLYAIMLAYKYMSGRK